MTLKKRPVLVTGKLKSGSLFYFTKQPPQRFKPRVLANGSMSASAIDPSSLIGLNSAVQLRTESLDLPKSEKSPRLRKLVARDWNGRS